MKILFLILFSTTINAQCLKIKHPLAYLKNQNTPLTSFLKTLTQAMKNRDLKLLKSLYHPQLKMEIHTLAYMFNKWHIMLKKPFVFSIQEILTITNNKNHKAIECPNFYYIPHQTYTIQHATTLQIRGEKELGRLFITIINKNNNMYIGFSHFQLQTINQQNLQNWLIKAEKSNNIQAYIYYQIARSLSLNSFHFKGKINKDLNIFMNKHFSEADWPKALSSYVNDEVLTANTKTASGGLKFNITFKKTYKDPNQHCKKTLNKLMFLKQDFSKFNCIYSNQNQLIDI